MTCSRSPLSPQVSTLSLGLSLMHECGPDSRGWCGTVTEDDGEPFAQCVGFSVQDGQGHMCASSGRNDIGCRVFVASPSVLSNCSSFCEALPGWSCLAARQYDTNTCAAKQGTSQSCDTPIASANVACSCQLGLNQTGGDASQWKRVEFSHDGTASSSSGTLVSYAP